ncbi:MAG TPA: acyltransferase [Reyranella sp.]|nr:acyltransferase [Reyranella sp.]
MGYYPGLDGLRGVAIALVVADHLCPRDSQFPGYVGVDVFFVLSGFLITTLLLAEWEQGHGIDLRRFYRRRLRRLYPALLVLLVGLLPAGAAVFGLQFYIAAALSAATYMTNFVVGIGHIHTGPFLHTWSLAQEEQFYLAWPLVLLLCLKKRVPLAFASMGLVLLAFVSWFEPEFTGAPGYLGGFRPDLRASGILIGCALALWLRLHDRMPVRRASMLGATGGLVGAGAVVAWSLARVAIPVPGLLQMLVCAGTSGVIVAAVHAPTAWASRTLALGPIRGLGQISYSLYLWHFAIFKLLFTEGVSIPLVIAVGVPASVALAILSRRYVELPFLRGAPEGRRTSRTIARSPSLPSPPVEMANLARADV